MSTLRSVLPDYLSSLSKCAENTKNKLRYLVNSWEKRTKNPEVTSIDHRTFNEYRRNCLAEGLAASGIETNITDICTILKAVELLPKKGKLLNVPKPLALQPHLVELGKLYAMSKHARWPTRWTPRERTDWWQALICCFYFWPYRVGDARRLRTEHLHDRPGEFYPRIEFQGSKTGAIYAYPMTPTVRRHVAKLLKLRRTPSGKPRDGTLFMLAKGSVRFVRSELKYLSGLAGIAPVTPQSIRRASLSSYACLGNDAGVIAHHGAGGLGVREAYVSMIRVLSSGIQRFEVPPEMLDRQERDERAVGLKRLIEIAKRLPASRLADMQRLAMAFAE